MPVILTQLMRGVIPEFMSIHKRVGQAFRSAG
jgi:hypothetical protein